MLRRLKDLRNERGATAVEYTVMVVAIAAVIVLSVSFLGQTTSTSIDCAGQSWQNKSSECVAGSGTTGSTTGSTTGTSTTGGTTTGSTTGSTTGGGPGNGNTGNATGNSTGIGGGRR